jgi:hypothetical protein
VKVEPKQEKRHINQVSLSHEMKKVVIKNSHSISLKAPELGLEALDGLNIFVLSTLAVGM